jgi:hypothetical protein
LVEFFGLKNVFVVDFQALEQASGMSVQVLHSRHVEVWQDLWTTGFGISHSFADNAINGAQVKLHLGRKVFGQIFGRKIYGRIFNHVQVCQIFLVQQTKM